MSHLGELQGRKARRGGGFLVESVNRAEKRQANGVVPFPSRAHLSGWASVWRTPPALGGEMGQGRAGRRGDKAVVL